MGQGMTQDKKPREWTDVDNIGLPSNMMFSPGSEFETVKLVSQIDPISRLCVFGVTGVWFLMYQRGDFDWTKQFNSRHEAMEYGDSLRFVDSREHSRHTKLIEEKDARIIRLELALEEVKQDRDALLYDFYDGAVPGWEKEDREHSIKIILEASDEDIEEHLKGAGMIDGKKINHFIKVAKKPDFCVVDEQDWRNSLNGAYEALSNSDLTGITTDALWSCIFMSAVYFCKGMMWAEEKAGIRQATNWPRY